MSHGRVFALLVVLIGLVHADGIYSKNSPVLQVTAQNYNSLIAQSNHTSILEFYAPWCGHCQNLKPVYEKAARNLAGLAKVAAINCDDEPNKPFCGQMDVKGFPTLKIIRPGPKAGKPVVEDYQGARTAKAIVDTVVEKIPNHVQRIQDNGLEEWLMMNADVPRAILFSEKGTISALIRSLAVDFLGGITFAQIRSREAVAVEKFGVTKFPSLVLLPAGSQDPLTYSEEMKKDLLGSFLSQAASPNPDPAPKKAKANTSSKKSKAATATKSTASAKSHNAPKVPPAGFEDFQEIILDDDTPLNSPVPIVETSGTPIAVPDIVPAIAMLTTPNELETTCLAVNSGHCLLVLLPKGSGSEQLLPQAATGALTGLAEIADKHTKRHAKLFPFYGVPAENQAGAIFRNKLGLRQDTDLEIVALNMKRGSWRLYEGGKLDITSLEGFVDAVKLGEGRKSVLPEAFFSVGSTPKPPEPTPEPSPEPEAAVDTPIDADPQPEAEPSIDANHDEL